ncbi:hypothetical protein R6242_11760 [Iodobacter sp. CM08]|uniref:hypothetical protein n=1 Tax=Iodobacter sp. CM08 TaxID=3085902 RepID=UPI00298236F0|nr:hypothetical protein [Iodobacter sp. CM08]MDW5417242.1 hypothetical protein [Iodobacter sp. CM08]
MHFNATVLSASSQQGYLIMLRKILTFGASLMAATAIASTVYVQREADGSVSYGDATTMSPKASLKTVRPATGQQSRFQSTASTPASASNETLEVLNKMELRNIKAITEAKAKIAALLNQTNHEKSPQIRSRLLNQIEAETQSTDLYTANLNQIRKNKEAISKEQTL